MEMAIKLTDVIFLYIVTTCFARSLIWLCGFFILTVTGLLMDSCRHYYEKFTKKYIRNYNSSDYQSIASIFKILYILRKVTRGTWDKRYRLKTITNEATINLVRNNILKVDVLNIVLLLLATALVENDGDAGASIYFLKDLMFDYGGLLADFITTHTDKLKMVLIVVLGVWAYNLGTEWSKLKEIARNDLKIKEMVLEVCNIINDNCDNIVHLKHTILDNCKIRITDNIGYDYEENQLIPVNRFTPEKEDSVAIQPVGLKICKLIDSLRKQNSNSLTGISSTYYSFCSLLLDELYSVDNIVYLEKGVLSYDDSDKRFQRIRDYFKKHHNQIYKHEFTNARVINNSPLNELGMMKDMAVAYLGDLDVKSKVLIWKYMYLNEMFRFEANKYLKSRTVFFEFQRFVFTYHVERFFKAKILF